MGFRDHHRFRRSGALRQNWRACFPYYDPFTIGIVGFIISLGVMNTAGRYVAL